MGGRQRSGLEVLAAGLTDANERPAHGLLIDGPGPLSPREGSPRPCRHRRARSSPRWPWLRPRTWTTRSPRHAAPLRVGPGWERSGGPRCSGAWRRPWSARTEELVRALSADQGKPLAEARDETGRARDLPAHGGRGRRPPRGPPPAVRRPVAAGAAPAGADRRDRRHRPVELAVHDGGRAVRTGAGGREQPWCGWPRRPPRPAQPCWRPC